MAVKQPQMRKELVYHTRNLTHMPASYALTTVLIGLLALATQAAACAHGEIVYAARYYLPPGSSGTSHYHIYVIDPDGTHRRQITFGTVDDYDPVWIDGGGRIEFLRGTDFFHLHLVTVSTDGGAARRPTAAEKAAYPPDDLPDEDLGDSPYYDSPDGRYACCADWWDANADGDDIVSRSNHHIIGVTAVLGAVLWLDNQRFAQIRCPDADDEGGAYGYVLYDVHGKQLSHAKMRDLSYRGDFWQTEKDWAVEQGYLTAIMPDPAAAGTYFAAERAKSATLYWFDPDAKTIRFLTCASSMAWSPDHRFFCTCAFTGTSQYDAQRVVWTDRLELLDAKTLRIKVLQGGLVDCAGSDWRGGENVPIYQGR